MLQIEQVIGVVQSPSSGFEICAARSPYSVLQIEHLAFCSQVAVPPVWLGFAGVVTALQTEQVIGVVQSPSSFEGICSFFSSIGIVSISEHFEHTRLRVPSSLQVGFFTIDHFPQSCSHLLLQAVNVNAKMTSVSVMRILANTLFLVVIDTPPYLYFNN